MTSGQSSGKTSGGPDASFAFDKAFEMELKAVEARRKLMAEELGGKHYLREEARARVGGA